MKRLMAVIIPIFFLVACFKEGNFIPLEKKAELFWKARVTGNYTFTYNNKVMSLYKDFLSEKQKKILTEKDFYARLNFQVLNFTIDKIEYNKDKTKATVTVLAKIDFNGYKLENVPLKTDWVKENGDWRISIDTQSNPFYDNYDE